MSKPSLTRNQSFISEAQKRLAPSQFLTFTQVIHKHQHRVLCVLLPSPSPAHTHHVNTEESLEFPCRGGEGVRGPHSRGAGRILTYQSRCRPRSAPRSGPRTLRPHHARLSPGERRLRRCLRQTAGRPRCEGAPEPSAPAVCILTGTVATPALQSFRELPASGARARERASLAQEARCLLDQGFCQVLYTNAANAWGRGHC